jgi:hypothetical protein
MAVEQLPGARLPGNGTGTGERVGRAEDEVCPTNSFPTLMLRPGLETRETQGTPAPWRFLTGGRRSAPRTKRFLDLAD